MVLAADAVRFCVLILGSAILGIASTVVVTYCGIYRRHRAMRKTGAVGEWSGMLPRHVVTIGLSYMVLVAASMVSTVMRSKFSSVPLRQ